MAPSTTNGQGSEWVTEVYVAVFPVSVAGETATTETILAGYQIDYYGELRIRATVETEISAVPDMVALCDKILAEQKELESYRLLKFDDKGIHELDPNDFRQSAPFSFRRHPQETWGRC